MTDSTPASPPAPAPAPPPAPISPRWNAATKFLASLIFVVVVGALLVRFHVMLVPLVFAFILAYLLNPLIAWITTKTRLPWGMAVTLVYLVVFILMIVVLVAAGIALAQQIEGLIRYVVEILPDLPARLESFTQQPLFLGPFTLDLSKPLAFGPFRLDLSTADLQPLYDQLLAAIQPALSQTSGVIGSLASSTASVLGWLLFILIISFYLLHDLKNLIPSLEQMLPAGYSHDIRRMAAELGPIWNAFLRGQITLAIIMGLVVGFTLAVLGVRYAPVLGLLAALMEFIPIVGPLLSGTVGTLVALFQLSNWLGLSPFYYALLIAAVYIILQQLENNLLVPRIIGGSLNLHPVVIIVGAIIAANLAGIVGLLLSAPAIATLRLFGRYVYCKMFDIDPWPERPPQPAPLRRSEWPPRWLKRWLPRKKLVPRQHGTDGR